MPFVNAAGGRAGDGAHAADGALCVRQCQRHFDHGRPDPGRLCRTLADSGEAPSRTIQYTRSLFGTSEYLLRSDPCGAAGSLSVFKTDRTAQKADESPDARNTASVLFSGRTESDLACRDAAVRLSVSLFFPDQLYDSAVRAGSAVRILSEAQ